MHIEVVTGDAMDVVADVLVLKYAQARYGVDAKVTEVLVRHGLCKENDIAPAPGEHALVGTRGHIGPRHVLYIGTERLHRFGYNEMTEFAQSALTALAAAGLSAPTVSTTIHGANYGLDAGEALEHVVGGFMGPVEGVSPSSLLIVERDPRRAALLESILQGTVRPRAQGTEARPVSSTPPVDKEHIFIAMPFSDAFEDIYNFGIYAPVRECGYVCENVGDAAFTGDVLQRIRDRISTAKLVIADLSEARPNVYLEVGFAWGRDIPVVFVAKEGEDIHFDVRTHRCLYYRNATTLAELLRNFLKDLPRN